MAGPDWSVDPDTPALNSNLARLYPDVLAHAMSARGPSADLAKDWHTRMHEGIDAPSPDYIGRFRGDTPTDLLDFEVHVGAIPGSRSYTVFGDVERLINWLTFEVDALQREVIEDLDRDLRVLEIAATMHGEWVRIHPFVNGNGRTARIWVLWVLARFGVPPLLKIRPRPNPPYGTASYASMTGDHSKMLTLLRQNYAALPAR